VLFSIELQKYAAPTQSANHAGQGDCELDNSVK
jgi:hypothetical protein